LATKVVDTVKKSHGNIVESTLDRSALWQAQRVFKVCVIFSNSNDTTLDFFDIQQSFKCLVKHTQAIF
jgi:2-C-methyl-D-erythritol 4-phosphate cytidylyltransferase